MAVIYKLTREDGLAYIGITSNFAKRVNAHKNSRRFAEFKIAQTEILFEGTYDECDILEEEYINLHDTFANGLNMTSRGKGKRLTEKFNTTGYKFSDKSRLKMSNSAKARLNRTTGYVHSRETKAAWSILRKGKCWGVIKIDKQHLIDAWHQFSPTFNDMKHLVSVKTATSTNPKFNNGRAFTYTRGKLALFKDIKSKEYNVTPRAINRIITHAKLISNTN